MSLGRLALALALLLLLPLPAPVAGAVPAGRAPLGPGLPVRAGHVRAQLLGPDVGGGAGGAREGPLARVDPLVDLQRLRRLQTLLAVPDRTMGAQFNGNILGSSLWLENIFHMSMISKNI